MRTRVRLMLARVKMRWFPWTLATLERSVGERLIEWADAADERAAHAGPKVVIRFGKVQRSTLREMRRRG